jgi:hypothetical protein
MPSTTVFVVQEYKLEKRRWRAMPPRQMSSETAAARMVSSLKEANRTSFAFSRTGDPEMGEFEPAKIIANHDVPEELFGGLTDG